jgi:hypothetical protein
VNATILVKLHKMKYDEIDFSVLQLFHAYRRTNGQTDSAVLIDAPNVWNAHNNVPLNNT